RELEPGEAEPPAANLITESVGLIAREIQAGEVVPEAERVSVNVGGQTKVYRTLKDADQAEPGKLWVGKVTKRFCRLHENDPVKKGQLLALIESSLAVDSLAIKHAKLLAGEADLQAATKTREESYQRLRTMETLAKQRAGALEDLRGAQLTYDRSRFDEITKAQALNLAQRELHQDRTLVAMHEIRTKIDGVIKTIHKRQGEVVRSLEPAFHVENSRRIRVEGFVESQFLPVLQEMKRQGKKVHLDPALPT